MPTKQILSRTLVFSLLAAMFALGAMAGEKPEAVRVAVVTDGSARAEAMANTLNEALRGLEVELTPEAANARWIVRLSESGAESLEIGASAGAGVEWASRFAGELERLTPSLRQSARAAVCRTCRGTNQISIGLGEAMDDAAAGLLAASALRESIKTVTGLAERTAGTPAGIVTPAPGSSLTSSSVTFAWDTGVGTARYWLFAGNWQGGDTLYSADQGTSLTATVTGLPTDGRKIYMRLWSLIDGAWVSRDFEYRAYSPGGGGPTKAQITTPVSGSTLSGTSATFNWSAGVAVTRYWLFAGLWTGGNTLYSADQGSSLSATVTGLPGSGQTIHVRLWSYIDGTWQSSDATYNASGSAGPPAKAAMTSPAAGSTLAATSVTFNWSAGTAVTRYYLMAGLWKGGNTLFNQDMGTALTAAVGGLPNDGRRLYVRLFSYINDSWQSNDYEYNGYDPSPGAAEKATLSAPAAGSTLAGSSATFSWTTGKRAEGYFLFIGDWQGGNSRYSQYFAVGTTTANVSGLPVDGRLLFVRLWSFINGQWAYNDYQVRAASR
jgi:hypothetical protein